MNIIYIDGGLGNQMFQYALAMKLEHLGRQVRLDVTKYADHYAHNGFELDKIFHIDTPLAENREIKKLGYLKENHWTGLLKKSFFCKKTFYSNESSMFDDRVFTLDHHYLEGYWQSEKYFLDIKEKVWKTYTFPEFSTEQQRYYAKKIQETCSVSVHIRRGDYLEYAYLQDICTLDYYKSAMRYFRENCLKPVDFFIFTNDIPWAKEHFCGKDCHLVEGNVGSESFRDMQLMTLCKHNIVANSSFSWWGAWLNRNPEKKVIAPERWTNDPLESTQDIIPESWIKQNEIQDRRE